MWAANRHPRHLFACGKALQRGQKALRYRLDGGARHLSFLYYQALFPLDFSQYREVESRL